ncbi:MAG TPA: hypothetical protein VHA70_02525 [Bauldia sp.]|nr:hypothetical protein [Bauldia sp.]
MSLRPIIVALALLLTSMAAQADALLDGLKTLPGNVEDVRVGGTWDEGGKNGIYRIIVSRSGGDTVTARLFVQWVSYDDTGGATVEDTVEIKEMADLKVDIVDFTSESDADGLSVFIQTLNPNGDSDLNYELFVTSPTQHRFGPASN